MKVYRIAQPVGQPVDPEEVQEVMEATERLKAAVANISQSLQIIERSGVAQLFQKENLIESIQSGDITRLDVNTIDQALEAMTHISQAVPIINGCLRVIQENPQAARALKTDVNSLSSLIITSLQTGDYSQFQSTMANFQSGMSGMGGTSGIALGT